MRASTLRPWRKRGRSDDLPRFFDLDAFVSLLGELPRPWNPCLDHLRTFLPTFHCSDLIRELANDRMVAMQSKLKFGDTTCHTSARAGDMAIMRLQDIQDIILNATVH
mmetsp:Transcript_1840/g.2769  ORF Transcript_1840/g.2769 Transcript_1840/m.2769 type:complete len:108 (+) Transcript_1840:181-504(+)